jgi:phenylacetyl-CoA:acceptor oxidoreductase subunit 2
LAEGTGVLALACALPAAHALARPVALVLAVLLLARALAWRAYRRPLAAPRAALAALDRPAPLFDGIGNWVAAGVAAAAAVIASDPMTAPIGAAAGAMAVAGGWQLKFVLVARAGFNQGFALPRLPVRGSGAPGPSAKPGW